VLEEVRVPKRDHTLLGQAIPAWATAEAAEAWGQGQQARQEEAYRASWGAVLVRGARGPPPGWAQAQWPRWFSSLGAQQGRAGSCLL
jgi:hypothetical protein